MKSRDVKLRLVFFAFWLLPFSSDTWSAGALLTGTVIDYGSNAGIGGVEVLVKNFKGQTVEKGTTDAAGMYKIELPASIARLNAREMRRVYFERRGYQRRPTIQSMTDLGREQSPVLMIRESADADYYKKVGATMAKQATELSIQERSERAYIVAALPATDKSRVVQSLDKSTSAIVLSDIRTAEETRRILSDISVQFASHGVAGPWVVPDYKSAGSIRLEGFVQSASVRTAAEEVARATRGVQNVRNDLMVVR